jgi:hypothetical protein
MAKPDVPLFPSMTSLPQPSANCIFWPMPLRGTIVISSRCTERLGFSQTTVMGMPLGRYFAFIGSVLLALLFLADWYLPQPAAMPARAAVDRSVIRLHSNHKWPERIVIDTSQPTIVPPPAKVADTLPASSPPAARAPSEALALMAPAPTVAPAITRKSAAKRRTRVVRSGGHATSLAAATEFRPAFPISW